jgi:hypothetical protein
MKLIRRKSNQLVLEEIDLRTPNAIAREWEAAHPQDILSLDSLLTVPK